jgi:hypothetical protein
MTILSLRADGDDVKGSILSGHRADRVWLLGTSTIEEAPEHP